MNKKLYVILTSLIRGVGGGHIYSVSKMKYLNSIGYDTLLIHANDPRSKMYIEDLRPYEDVYNNHLLVSCYFYCRPTIERIINNIIDKFFHNYEKYESIIIESHSVVCSTWGEMLSAKLNAKHFVYLLDEHPLMHKKVLYDFFRFKLKRGELVGIGRNSIKDMFEGWMEIPSSSSPYLKAYTPNPLKDIPYPIDDIPQADYIIGSIGRLEKKFLIPALEVVKRFAENHIDKTFTILLIGGAVDTNIPEKKIATLFKNSVNVKLYITGLIYPIPISLVRIPNIFLSMSGSCQSSVEMGKLTVSFDVSDSMPIGLLNNTTDNYTFRDKEGTPPNLYVLLDDVLIKKKYTETNPTYVESEEIIDYSDHLDYLNKSDINRHYYCFDECELRGKDLLKRLFLNVIPISWVRFLFFIFPNKMRLFKNHWRE